MTNPHSSLSRVVTNWQLRNRLLEVGRITRVMGIVNVTPDSFSDGGLYLDPEQAVDHALSLLDEGADIVDLGAESTRPGSRAGTEGAISAEEEKARLLPVLEGIINTRPDALISVDTYKSATARAAVEAGAQIVNDVSGFLWDSRMASVCAQLQCGVVLMHTRGLPEEWRDQPSIEPDRVLSAVTEGLKNALTLATAAGIAPQAVVLDPGYGFGKRLGENYDLLARQAELLRLGRPMLAGVSRKSFLSRTVNERRGALAIIDGQSEAVLNESRETASIAALVTAILHGASIVRVHAVRAAVEAAAIADAVLEAG